MHDLSDHQKIISNSSLVCNLSVAKFDEGEAMFWRSSLEFEIEMGKNLHVMIDSALCIHENRFYIQMMHSFLVMKVFVMRESILNSFMAVKNDANAKGKMT